MQKGHAEPGRGPSSTRSLVRVTVTETPSLTPNCSRLAREHLLTNMRVNAKNKAALTHALDPSAAAVYMGFRTLPHIGPGARPPRSNEPGRKPGLPPVIGRNTLGICPSSPLPLHPKSESVAAAQEAHFAVAGEVLGTVLRSARKAHGQIMQQKEELATLRLIALNVFARNGKNAEIFEETELEEVLPKIEATPTTTAVNKSQPPKQSPNVVITAQPVFPQTLHRGPRSPLWYSEEN
eukprot:TRINITY_DN34371_c0_g1_i1.p1 TRINITY_DN34371_c0_g1~~TRINITY_DN34371_c0_g1_i1.p1  ORF type:complete len:250 (+),score=27.22 TRINITY_DN34371_c0_g1_i1:40-750(+)